MKTDLVVAGYIFHENKILLVHHKNLDMWLPVGGHIKENEVPDDALLREIDEETGIQADVISNNGLEVEGNAKRNLAMPFNVNVHSSGNHDHCCFFYIRKAASDKININKSELKDFAWFSREELSDEKIPPDVRSLAIRAFELMTAKDKSEHAKNHRSQAGSTKRKVYHQ